MIGRHKVPFRLFMFLAALPLLTTGCSRDDEPVPDLGEARQVVVDVVSGLGAKDGPLACSHMQRDVQEALMSATGAPDCLEAVSSAALDKRLLLAARNIDGSDIEIDGSTVVVNGAGGQALARLLGTSGVWLAFMEGSWMLQASSKSNSGATQ